MLKIRLMGKKEDIGWFTKLLQKNRAVEVLEVSEPYTNKGTSQYFRAYIEVEKK